MANYSVWMLEASNISLSGGVSLSGITQGDGSNLVGATLRLENNQWVETFLRDNDTNFDDNDGNQRLDGAQTIGGTSYANNTQVEAEYRLTLRDPATGQTWEALGYNVNNSSPAYATIEGLAFVSGFPPVGVDLEVVSAAEGPGSFGQPAVGAGDLAVPPCFTPGTRILSEPGYVPVEVLRPGDRVQTRDAGFQPLCWVGAVDLDGARLAAHPEFQPVRIAAHAFGFGRPARDLLVSPQHRILLSHWLAELHFGESEVLVPALHLVNGHSIRRESVARVTYLHIMCDTHQVIWAEGMATETFLPGTAALAGLPDATVAELLALFPELAGAGATAARPARPILRHWESRMLRRDLARGASAA